MKRVKRVKRVKAMTLIEIIISMLVFSVLTLIMVKVCEVSSSLLMNANHVNNKTTAEAPYGATRDANGLQNAILVPGTTEPATDDSGNPLTIETTPVTITVTSGGYTRSINTTRYSTAAAAALSDANTNTNMDSDLNFYVIETTPVGP